MSKKMKHGEIEVAPIPPSDRVVTPAKRIIFSTITLLLVPLMLLFAVEGMLRIFSYGGNLSLVIRDRDHDRDVYRLNRAVARRYFSQRGVVCPEPKEDEFEVVKPSGTIRIFCVGESTMQGFPYEHNLTPPSFLQDRLRAQLSRSRVEVINVGLSAVGSYIVKDFIDELADYQPDLYVVYVGHNEFYGAYGRGSSVVVRGPAWLTRLSLKLLRFKTYLLLRDGYAWIASRLHPETRPQSGTLMAQMVGQGDIPLGSAIYREGLSEYAANLSSIIAAAHNQHVPILFSTLVSNIADQAPFRSLFAEWTTEDERRQCLEWIAEGDSLVQVGNLEAAAQFYRRTMAVDSTYALACFKFGKSLQRLEYSAAARRMLIRAKDMDALRFRATEEFQAILIQTCEREGAAISRVDAAFENASPHAMVGHELILEHLHPNVRGYLLMAKTWAEDIRTLDLLGRQVQWSGAPDDSALLQRAEISPFDEGVARLRIDALTHHWPFSSSAGGTSGAPRDTVGQIAYAYVNHKVPWSEAKYDVAEFYAGKRNFDAARREMLGVAHAVPVPSLPLARVGDFYVMEGRNREGESMYREAIAAEDNSYARMSLGVMYESEGRPAEAIRELEIAFAMNAKETSPFPAPVTAYGRLCLGKAYESLGRITDARTEMQHALALDPGLRDARAFLESLGTASSH